MAPFYFFGLFDCSQKCPSQAVSIRAICPEKYTVINQATNEVIEEVEESKAFFEVGTNVCSHSQSDNWVHVSLLDDLSITQTEWIDWVESLTAVSVVVCLDLLEKLFGTNTIVFIELLFFFPLQVYEGAVYMHQGKTYLCRSLDITAKVALCQEADLKYYTKTRDFTDVHVLGGELVL